VVDPFRVGGGEPSETPAVAVETEPHEIPSPHRQVALEHALLRDVADPRPLLGGRRALDLDPAGRRREQPEHDPDQRRLAGAVRPEYGEQLAALRARSSGPPRAGARRS
jgi:hypothetical protein